MQILLDWALVYRIAPLTSMQRIPGGRFGLGVLRSCVPLLDVAAAILALSVLYRANRLPGHQRKILFMILARWGLNHLGYNVSKPDIRHYRSLAMLLPARSDT